VIMTLRDELPSQNQSCILSINNSAHDEINEQIEAFLKKGGQIKQYGFGATANSEAVPLIVNESNPNENDFKSRMKKGKIGARNNKAEKPMFAFPERSKYAKRSDYGMNIRKNGAGFSITIGGANIANGIETLEQAIITRDKARASLGMTKAEY
jgi:hypothetical protein